jgi:hypothetical protein
MNCGVNESYLVFLHRAAQAWTCADRVHRVTELRGLTAYAALHVLLPVLPRKDIHVSCAIQI